MFQLIYVVFLICSSLYVLQDFGVILTLRQWATLILFFACLNDTKKVWIDGYMKLYLLFVLCFGVSSFIDGYYVSFFQRLIGDYFVVYVGYWATFIMCTKYGNTSLCINTYTALGILAAVVTIFQLFHISLLDPLLSRFHLMQDQMQIDRMGTDMDLVGRAISGVFSSPVDNSHKLLVFFMLALGFWRKNRLINIVAALVIFVGLFAVQVRTPFYAAVLLFLIYIFRSISQAEGKTKNFLIIGLFILLGLVFLEIGPVLTTSEFRYGLGIDLTGREGIWAKCYEYLLSHPFLGGLYDYMSIYGRLPHNLIMNALIYSGVIGALFIMWIICKQLWKIKNTLFSSIQSDVVFYSLAVCGCIIDSFFHNIQIVNGDILLWICWGFANYGAFPVDKGTSDIASNK